MTIMKYKCTNCKFEFKDESLIFYINNNKIIETALTPESSKMMSKSEISGYVYIGYCSNCETYIKTYVPEIKENIDENKIIRKIETLTNNNLNQVKILVFDFNNTSFSYRRKILSENTCPNCNASMCLLIDEFHLCPKCGEDKIITME